MILPESLEMIPPILVKERTFGWYPPAHDQFAKVPYKNMAVLDDYSQYKIEVITQEKKIENPVDTEQIVDDNSSILSSKLNAIRQDLTRRRIDPAVIRQVQLKKFNNCNQFMNISSDWKPKYPEPDLKVIANNCHRQPLTVSGECKESISENHRSHDKQTQDYFISNSLDKKRENKNLNSMNSLDLQESNLGTPKRFTSQRPHTAPGIPFQNSKPKSSSITSSQPHRFFSAKTGKGENAIQNQSYVSKRLTQSTSNIPSATYEEDLVKYKWLMEIPGDPFSIKQPHIPVKQPYFQKIEDCKILPPELRMSKQNSDTFFYNTMPYQSMSFDISPNFTSEKYNARKNLLRSQGKWNFSSKNFSFVY